MIKIYCFLLSFLFSISVFSYDIGSSMWGKSVKDKRPIGVLFTITGMATAPLLIPVAINQMVNDGNENAFSSFFVGAGWGFLWMLGYEGIGIVDILTLGWISRDGEDLFDFMIKPAYCYYIDGIDNTIEDWEKHRE